MKEQVFYSYHYFSICFILTKMAQKDKETKRNETYCCIRICFFHYFLLLLQP